jgi:hypothetical protein
MLTCKQALLIRRGRSPWFTTGGEAETRSSRLLARLRAWARGRKDAIEEPDVLDGVGEASSGGRVRGEAMVG